MSVLLTFFVSLILGIEFFGVKDPLSDTIGDWKSRSAGFWKDFDLAIMPRFGFEWSIVFKNVGLFVILELGLATTFWWKSSSKTEKSSTSDTSASASSASSVRSLTLSYSLEIWKLIYKGNVNYANLGNILLIYRINETFRSLWFESWLSD